MPMNQTRETKQYHPNSRRRLGVVEGTFLGHGVKQLHDAGSLGPCLAAAASLTRSCVACVGLIHVTAVTSYPTGRFPLHGGNHEQHGSSLGPGLRHLRPNKQ